MSSSFQRGAAVLGLAGLLGCNSFHSQDVRARPHTQRLEAPPASLYELHGDYFKLYLSMMHQGAQESNWKCYTPLHKRGYIVSSLLSSQGKPSLRVYAFSFDDLDHAQLYIDGERGNFDGTVDKAFECSISFPKKDSLTSFLKDSPLEVTVSLKSALNNPAAKTQEYRDITHEIFSAWKKNLSGEKDEKPFSLPSKGGEYPI